MRLGDREWKQARKVSFLQYDSILNTHSMKILKMFGINGTFGKITYREYQKTEYLRNDSEAKEILQEKISDFLESLGEKGVQIISKDVKIETKVRWLGGTWGTRGAGKSRNTGGYYAERGLRH